MLDILFRDEHLIAINKPHGLLVHRSPIAADVEAFAVQTLRDQISQWVTPVHRLDRKTGGVLLFALMFLWQVPHFLAIAIFRADEYAREAAEDLDRARAALETAIKNAPNRMEPQ